MTQKSIRLILVAVLTPVLLAARCNRPNGEDPALPTGPQRAKVLVSWTMVSSEGLYGFNIYRGESPEGPWERVNPTPILGADGGTTTIPRQYRHVDASEKLRVGQRYWYWLEAVDADGTKRRVWWPPKSIVAKVRVDEEFPSALEER